MNPIHRLQDAEQALRDAAEGFMRAGLPQESLQCWASLQSVSLQLLRIGKAAGSLPARPVAYKPGEQN
ncbi:MAG: hypothetical protein KGR26_14475 [Cyanobacteria bacterium REEB65]|nr:hypothetical protein [Cyanobacteria bacterium REEB65]